MTLPSCVADRLSIIRHLQLEAFQIAQRQVQFGAKPKC